MKSFNFTLFDRKWFQTALEIGGETPPNMAIDKGTMLYLPRIAFLMEKEVWNPRRRLHARACVREGDIWLWERQ